jgi:hypothetical protein
MLALLVDSRVITTIAYLPMISIVKNPNHLRRVHNKERDQSKMDFNKILDGYYQSYATPGKVHVVNHLRSEKGRAMNGKRAVTVGLDPPGENRRVQVRLLDDQQKPTGGTIRLKPKNLISPSNYCSKPSENQITKVEAIGFLKKAMENAIKDGLGKVPDPEEARDPYRRIQHVQECLKSEDNLPSSITCTDFMVPEEDMNFFEKLKWNLAPACCGDGSINFQRFGEGVIAGKNDECSICLDAILGDLIRLPCNHRFHVNCVKPWFHDQGQHTCPTCRTPLVNSWDSYVIEKTNEHIQKRFDEWFLSGMCERCQAVNMENDPVVVVTENGEDITMPLSVARQRGHGNNYQSVQGHKLNKVQIHMK